MILLAMLFIVKTTDLEQNQNREVRGNTGFEKWILKYIGIAGEDQKIKRKLCTQHTDLPCQT